jgi:hypothetical protein
MGERSILLRLHQDIYERLLACPMDMMYKNLIHTRGVIGFLIGILFAEGSISIAGSIVLRGKNSFLMLVSSFSGHVSPAC